MKFKIGDCVILIHTNNRCLSLGTVGEIIDSQKEPWEGYLVMSGADMSWCDAHFLEVYDKDNWYHKKLSGN